MMRKNRKSICYLMTLALCVTLGSSYVRAEETKGTTAQGINVAYHTQDEIRAFCAENAAGINDALTFAEEPVVSGDYSAGKLSDETLNSAINMFNQMRYIAGISYDVQLDDTYNSLTQTAALVNYVNGMLGHFPSKPADMDKDLYDFGAKGAGESNIAWASWKNAGMNESIIGWLDDGDDYNIDRLGHRRWVLNPKMKYTGFGAVTGTKGTYSAMYSFDMKNTKASEYGVAWPAQNMPVEYFGMDFPWSVSMGKNVDITSVKVKLTRESDGTVWNFSSEKADGYFNVNNAGYGQSGCIIFRPDTSIKYAAGDVYDVDITGLGSDVSYKVNFFSLKDSQDATAKPTEAPTETPTAAPTVKPTETPTAKPTVKPTASPTTKPTVKPTAVPTKEPVITEKPETPTDEPEETEAPTTRPTATPTAKPIKVKIKKWKINKNKVTVYFGKVKNASGYQVRYSTSVKYNKDLSSKAVSYKSTKTTVTLKKSRKKHFIQMRAYTKKNGKKVYGSWGNTIKIYKNLK